MTETIQLSDLFYQAGTLMLVGMGFVYAFLMLMILVIQNIIAPLGKKFGAENIATKAQRDTSINQTTNQIESSRTEQSATPEIIAAISSAITQYRSKKP